MVRMERLVIFRAKVLRNRILCICIKLVVSHFNKYIYTLQYNKVQFICEYYIQNKDGCMAFMFELYHWLDEEFEIIYRRF